MKFVSVLSHSQAFLSLTHQRYEYVTCGLSFTQKLTWDSLTLNVVLSNMQKNVLLLNYACTSDVPSITANMTKEQIFLLHWCYNIAWVCFIHQRKTKKKRRLSLWNFTRDHKAAALTRDSFS